MLENSLSARHLNQSVVGRAVGANALLPPRHHLAIDHCAIVDRGCKRPRGGRLQHEHGQCQRRKGKYRRAFRVKGVHDSKPQTNRQTGDKDAGGIQVERG